MAYWMFLCVIVLQMTSSLAQQTNEGLVDLEDLYLRLFEGSCNAVNYTAEYLRIREKEGLARQSPPWPDIYGLKVPAFGTIWSGDGSHFKNLTLSLPTYEEFITDLLFGTVKEIDYIWCVYLFSETMDLHGCKGNGTEWATPEFKRLGLLNKLHLIRSLDYVDFVPTPIILLEIEPISLEESRFGNLLWNKALVSMNIHWREGFSPVGEYSVLDVSSYSTQFISSLTAQSSVFLVEGHQKAFYCEVYGSFNFYSSGWRIDGRQLQFVLDLEPCDLESREVPCEDIYFTRSVLPVGNCEEHRGKVSLISTDRLILNFQNATMNDTGEYTCFINGITDVGELQAKSIFVYVVFIETFDTVLEYTKEGELRCTVKAPTNSTISLRHNNVPIATSQSLAADCDSLPRTSVTSKQLDDQFSHFTAIITICSVVGDNVGTYECGVEYHIPTSSELQYSSITADVTIRQSDTVELQQALSLHEGIGIGIATLLASILLIATITVCLFFLVIRVSRQRALRRSSRKHLKNLQLTFAPQNSLLKNSSSSSAQPPLTPAAVPCDNPVEFPRKNLVLHQQIGKGRFGKVLVGNAYNIIPHLPTHNKVAVKMAVSSQNNELIRAELEVMKKLDSHKNICNLLAYCSTGKPVYIILEYSCHGNMKEYLDLCRQTVLQSEKSVFISSIYHNPISSGSKYEEKHPGLLSETNIRSFAFQIASGLQHLEAMEIIHCDLAARNILISEGFVLKISDFGLSKKISDEDGYHNIVDVDGILAIKWAPPEVLESKGYSLKSDVWSYAVIVWEMATYGSRPFADHKIGVSLNRFVQFLQAGNRLPQPNGLGAPIYQMLLKCWTIEPSDRPAPSLLKEFFQEF